jgi:hypothetical protein
MSDSALRDELTKLKEQVAELQSTRSKPPSPPDLQVPDSAIEDPAMTGAGQSDQDGVSFEDAEQKDTEEQIRDFVNALDQEIKSTNPMTVLVVFSLGVLIGRLLPR